MDKAQTLLRVGLLEAQADEVFERDDGGLVGVGDVEEDVVYRGGEANSQEERGGVEAGCMMTGDVGWRRSKGVVGRRRRDRGEASVMRPVWRGRRGAVVTPASAHLVGDVVSAAPFYDTRGRMTKWTINEMDCCSSCWCRYGRDYK